MVLHERMINMPPAVAAPLYQLLTEELSAAAAGTKTAPAVTHYLMFSRVFSASALEEDEEMDGPEGETKRRKTIKKGTMGGAVADDDLGMFHPEDALLGKVRETLTPWTPFPLTSRR